MNAKQKKEMIRILRKDLEYQAFHVTHQADPRRN